MWRRAARATTDRQIGFYMLIRNVITLRSAVRRFDGLRLGWPAAVRRATTTTTSLSQLRRGPRREEPRELERLHAHLRLGHRACEAAPRSRAVKLSPPFSRNALVAQQRPLAPLRRRPRPPRAPFVASSAMIRPTSGASLNPWPENPAAMATRSPEPGRKSRMKSSVGVIVYMHVSCGRGMGSEGARQGVDGLAAGQRGVTAGWEGEGGAHEDGRLVPDALEVLPQERRLRVVRAAWSLRAVSQRGVGSGARACSAEHTLMECETGRDARARAPRSG